MAASVEIVFGPPGTGKTTALLEHVEKLIREERVSPERIAFLSFSRAAVGEAIARSGRTREELPWFRTIHSLGYKLCNLVRVDVLDVPHMLELSDRLGEAFSNVDEYLGIEDGPAYRGGRGYPADRALDLWALARARRTTLEHEWQNADSELDITFAYAEHIVRSYERFKEEQGLWDYSDMVTRAQGELPAEYVILDEAQDTATAQWDLLRRVTRADAKVLIAGDDDQAIYSWSGADPRPLWALKADRRVLPHSYRLPSRIKHVADNIARNIVERHPKSYTPNGQRGEVQYVSDVEQIDLRDGKQWLLLARTNYQLRAWRRLAKQQGVVYLLENGQWSWRLTSVRAAYAYHELRTGHKIPRAEIKYLYQALDRRNWAVEDYRGLPEEVTWDAAVRGLDKTVEEWWAVFTHMSDEDKSYIRDLRQNKESLRKPGRVKILTAHRAKGLEAQNVAVLADIPRRASLSVVSGNHRLGDAERRVQYVATTRASEKIIFVQAATPYHWEWFA